MAVNPNPDKLETVPTVAPMPFLVKGKVAEAFKTLKTQILAASGVDYLSKCADIFRTKNFSSDKPGVATHSNHQTGRAVDFDQSTKALYIESDRKGPKQYFRIWIKCVAQDGSQGTLAEFKDIRGFAVRAYCVDFTKLAESLGWSRIPAHGGWSTTGKNYSKMEFWHYEIMEGLSWQQAMDYIYKK